MPAQTETLKPTASQIKQSLLHEADMDIVDAKLISGLVAPALLTNTDHLTKGMNTVDATWRVLDSNQIRQGPSHHLSDADRIRYKDRIAQRLTIDEPLQLAVTLFPFKLHVNPAKTDREQADLGEVAVISRLASVADTVSQVYPPGAKWIVATESLLYAPMFGISTAEAEKYQDSISSNTRTLLGTDFERKVELVPLVDMIEDKKKYYSSVGLQYHIMHHYPSSQDKTDISAQIPTITGCVSDPTDIREITKIATLYVAHKRVLSALEVVEKNYPGHIKTTVIPKPGQLGINYMDPKTRLLPHHGVPVLTSEGRLTIRKKSDAITNSSPIHIKSDTEYPKPFFYLEDK